MLVLFFIAVLFASPALAVTIEQPLASPAQEQQAQAIFKQLKCVVCQGQALAESDAQFAREMRSDIREQVESGKSERDILNGFAERYGKTILLNPPFESTTLLLWLAPLVILLIGAVILKRSTRRK